MGKRFGRNQKRKMREEIQRKDNALDECFRLRDGLERNLRDLHFKMEGWARDIVHVFGRDTPFAAEYGRRAISYIPRAGDRLQFSPPPRPMQLHELQAMTLEDAVTVSRRVLEAFVTVLDVYPDKFEPRILVELDAGNVGRSYYAIDRTMLESLPPRAVEGIAAEIAKGLAAILGDRKGSRLTRPEDQAASAIR